MHHLCAALVLVAAQDGAERARAPVRVSVVERLQMLEARSGWQRLDWDERWNESGPTSAAVDGLANVIAPESRDVSYVALPIRELAPRVVTGLLVHVVGSDDDARPFLITELRVLASPTHHGTVAVRRVRVLLPGEDRQLRLAEVRLHGDGIERARLAADQSSVDGSNHALGAVPPGATADDVRREVARRWARRAIDGFTSAARDLPIACTARENDPWWEVDLGRVTPLRSVEVFGDPRDAASLEGFVVVFLGDDGAEVWRSAPTPAPAASLRRSVDTGPTIWQPLAVVAHSASSFAPGYELARALSVAPDPRSGWAPAAGMHRAGAVLALPPRPWESAVLRIELRQDHGDGRVLTRFGAEVTCAEALTPPVPGKLHALAWARDPRLGDEAEPRLMERFLLATSAPEGAFALADADLFGRAQQCASRADDPTRALIEMLSTRPVVGLTPEERIELSAFLTALER